MPTDTRTTSSFALCIAVLLLTGPLVGCLSSNSSQASLTQKGSSTVLPLAEEWAFAFANASISVSGGGSSAGLSALLTGKADLGDASRKIAAGDYEKAGCSVSTSQIEQAQQGDHPWQYPECNGITPTEWVVAYDVLTVIVNNDNDWIGDGLNYTQLRAIFTTEGTAETWSEVPGLENAPDEKIQIFAPDEASGTYDFFFEEVVGSTEKSLLNAGSGRYSGSANDNEIIRAISQTKHAVGFVGFSYYLQNKDRIQAVPIAEEGTDTVEPSYETVQEYPITRPLHVYTDGIPESNATSASPLNQYMRFILSEEGQSIVRDVGYVQASSVDPGLVESQRSALR